MISRTVTSQSRNFLWNPALSIVHPCSATLRRGNSLHLCHDMVHFDWSAKSDRFWLHRKCRGWLIWVLLHRNDPLFLHKRCIFIFANPLLGKGNAHDNNDALWFQYAGHGYHGEPGVNCYKMVVDIKGAYKMDRVGTNRNSWGICKKKTLNQQIWKIMSHDQPAQIIPLDSPRDSRNLPKTIQKHQKTYSYNILYTPDDSKPI